MKKKIITVSAALVLAAVLLGAADFSGIFRGGEVIVVIDEGEGLKAAAKKLKKSGVVMSETLFLAYAKPVAEKIKPGSHKMNKRMGYFAAADELVSIADGDKTVMLTVPEGYEIYRVCEKVNRELGISERDFYRAAEKSYDLDFLADVPRRESRAEGYLFPDTYEFMSNASAEDIVLKMLERFSQIWSDEYSSRAEEFGMTMDEVVILASVIEREAGSRDEMGKVSSVFHNRLKIGMPLQSCATVQYILKERKDVLSIEDTKIDSPYNTYMYKGLPVGPIASPGKAAIEAALYPEDTEYYYFKVNSEGVTVFSKTLEEHNSK